MNVPRVLVMSMDHLSRQPECFLSARSHPFASVTLLVLVVVLQAGRAYGQTAPQPSPPAEDESVWSNITFGATLEGYYQYRLEQAIRSRHSAARVRHAEQHVQHPAGRARRRCAAGCRAERRYGLRVDLQFGQATSHVQGNPANEPRPDVYRDVWQAYGTYVFPVGRGLQVDFGKFASNLGYETNYAKDNVNFSRALLFNFLPFYHTGLRTTLPVSDKVTVLYMLTNGIQQTEDFNNFKSNHFTAIVKPVGAVTWTMNYYFGQEQPDGGEPAGPDGWFRVFDTYAAVTATRALSLAVDVNHASNQVHRGDAVRR